VKAPVWSEDGILRYFLLIALAAAICVLAAGCYTMLSHPTVGTMGSVHGEGRNCSDCHTDQDYYYHHYPYYYDSYWNYSGWWSYYCDPWWWGGNYWYWPDPEYGVPLPVERTGIYDQRVRPGTTPKLVPDASGGSGGGTGTPSSGGRNTNAGEDNTRRRSGNSNQPPSKRPPRPTKRPDKPKKEPKKGKETKERE
jgi:hypothetical protein